MRISSLLRPPRDSRSRYLFLLIWLIVYLLGDAVAFEIGGTTRVVDLIFAGVLLATLRMLSRNPVEFAVATSIGGLTMVAAFIATIHPTVAILATKSVLAAAFCGFLSAVILREVLQDDVVDADTIRGAICAYLFVGVCWAGAYAFVEELSPGSLSLPAEAHGAVAGETRPESLLYFSFVTLATLGYGDILPTTPVTRALAWMEAVFGQFYIAALVARLVGLMQMRPPDGRGR
jgi:hypothetical protein